MTSRVHLAASAKQYSMTYISGSQLLCYLFLCFVQCEYDTSTFFAPKLIEWACSI